ncbi:Ser-Thr-rich glycosyl-phosphatidyl-inositol-anchored membrane family-domain-containing protein [Aspergillus bertholletiae]|uniref:Ser-Thr-rich glycosyl-phosphatidyl-inositol-anchored membrane family-domain-containing protein n=1 Tax=Aspergillus bertholletiae TaxID=1226010 RepID=A0A5N7AR82_9EURO|nr:Ser-Thr-rich glycosyl-phosphatidyl-inositol-anchored membrane family-domain-containing protein [Aspergillus bertholletiae]
MRSIFYLTLSAMASLAAAATGANPFNIPREGYSFEAGKPTTLSWDPTTSGTITLRLQWGAVMTSNTGTTIASNIPNSGSFTWTPPANLAAQPDYTIEIFNDDDVSEVNYLPRFTVAGATAVASTSSSATTTAETTSATKSATETTTNTNTATNTATTASGTSTESTSASASATGTSTGTSTGSASTSTEASSTTSASASTSTTSVPNINGGMVNRVSGGMLAIVLGAIAVL